MSRGGGSQKSLPRRETETEPGCCVGWGEENEGQSSKDGSGTIEGRLTACGPVLHSA